MKKDKNMDEKIFGKVYYRLRQGVITKCDRYVITNCDRYYKLRQPLLQIATGITNCDVITNCDSTNTTNFRFLKGVKIGF